MASIEQAVVCIGNFTLSPPAELMTNMDFRVCLALSLHN